MRGYAKRVIENLKETEKMETEEKLAIILALLPVVAGIIAYPLLPEIAATHWDIYGSPNGFMPKIWAAFLVPAISIVLAGLFFVIPRIDPLGKNIMQFRKEYFRFCIVLLAFMFIVYLQSILWNTYIMVSFSLTMPVLLGLLFIYLGSFLSKTKQSWFIGIRTPWTMSNAEVWDETHRLGGSLFQATGIVSIVSVLLPPFGMLLPVAMVVGSAVALVVYSYLAYVRIEKRPKERIIKKIVRNAKRD
jgi:uncharacterized membrane protein